MDVSKTVDDGTLTEHITPNSAAVYHALYVRSRSGTS